MGNIETTENMQADEKDLLKEGQRCLLNMGGRHFMVTIIEVGKKTVRVSFFGKYYPIEGMYVSLEFHDDSGFYYYTTYVVRRPEYQFAGMLLRRPSGVRRHRHRDAYRIPTEITVQIKDLRSQQVYDANLKNISGSGGLIQTAAPLDLDTPIEMILPFPDTSQQQITGQVVHVSEPIECAETSSQQFGVHFADLNPETERTIGRFIWQRVQEISPQE